MEFRVVLIESDEGFSVKCPALEGCFSQGKTKEEALQNIKEAIKEWLAVEDEDNSIKSITEEMVTL